MCDGEVGFREGEEMDWRQGRTVELRLDGSLFGLQRLYEFGGRFDGFRGSGGLRVTGCHAPLPVAERDSGRIAGAAFVHRSEPGYVDDFGLAHVHQVDDDCDADHDIGL